LILLFDQLPNPQQMQTIKTLIVLYLITLPAFLWADMGSCVVYKAKYVLKSGEEIIGYLPMGGYDDYAHVDADNSNKYCGDKEFQQLINRYFFEYQKELSFTLYRRIELVKFDKSIKRYNFLPHEVAYTDSASMVVLKLDDIKYTIFYNARPSLWGNHHSLLQVVGPTTFDFLQSHRVYSVYPVNNPYDSTYLEYGGVSCILNFNSGTSRETLGKITRQFSRELFSPKDIQTKNHKMILFKYQSQGYFFVEWLGGC